MNHPIGTLVTVRGNRGIGSFRDPHEAAFWRKMYGDYWVVTKFHDDDYVGHRYQAYCLCTGESFWFCSLDLLQTKKGQRT
jgi:hypothetical protein